ncbi:hypothetical protein VCHENC02_0349A, partial [Vibrio harveyi]
MVISLNLYCKFGFNLRLE